MSIIGMNARPFVLHQQKTLEILRQRIAPVLEQWCTDWGLPMVSDVQVDRDFISKITVRDFDRFPATSAAIIAGSSDSLDYRLFSYTFSAGGRVAEVCIVCSSSVCWELCGALIAEDGGADSEPSNVDAHSLSARLLSKLYGDLLGRLPGELRPVLPDLQELEDKFTRAGSGALTVTVTIGHIVFHLQLSLLALQHLFDIAHPGSDRKLLHKPKKQEYLGLCPNASINMEVRLPSIKARIADIQSLVVGDVLKLECELDQPLDLYINGEKRSHQVYLGGIDNTRAIKLQTL